jgi:NADH:ubiquinone oxidoreductase subunit 3 (subunit A)
MRMQNKSTEKRNPRAERPQITTRTKVYIVIIALVLAAVKTIIPFPYVSKECMLGYKAGCSFTPISTIILIVMIVIAYVVAKRKKLI